MGAFCADGVTLFQIRCWCLAHRFGAWRQVKGFSARCLINRSGAYCLVGFKVCGAARLPSVNGTFRNVPGYYRLQDALP